MDLQSARALKSQLSAEMFPLLASPITASSLGIPARRIQGTAVPPSMALGIAPRHQNDFKIAVRLQQPHLVSAPFVQDLRNRMGDEVDIRYIGQVNKRQGPPPQQGRNRPLRIGCSVGQFQITAGTLGCFVRSRTGQGRAMILSNNHVLADENRATIGDPILQPGAFDGGTVVGDTVARLVNFEPLNTSRTNLVDCAVAEVVDGIDFVSNTIDGIGPLSGLAAGPLQTGDIVRKTGRTTGTRTGRITAFELDNVVVTYEIGNLSFDNQIEIEGEGSDAFSRGGDSGSLVVNQNVEAVGLLFAGGETGGSNGLGLTYANPIGAVLDSLNIDLFTGA